MAILNNHSPLVVPSCMYKKCIAFVLYPYDARLNADTELSLFVCASNHWEEGGQWSYPVAIVSKSFHWFFLALKQSKNYYLYHAFT